MKKIKIALILLCMSGLLFFENCSKSSDPAPIPLKAVVGPDQTVAPLTTVTLDGSASTGPGTLVYAWTYNGGSNGQTNLQFSDFNVAKPTFVPPKNGVYGFTLTVTSGNQFSTANVTITATGVLTLGGTLSASLALIDIEPDNSKPDYILSSDLIIPAGISVTSSGSVNIDAAANTGILIQGGSLTSSLNGSTPATINFTSTSGWKGILMSSGNLSLNYSQVQKAGKSLFTGQSEAAAITVTGGTLALSAGVAITGSTGYDLLITNMTSNSSVANTSFSAAKPIKASIFNLPAIGANGYGTYDFIVLTTPGAGTTAVSYTGSYIFQGSTKYYIDGDFTAGSSISSGSSCTIYMKAGAGILASSGLTSSGTTFDGYDGINFGAAWKGIAIGTNNNLTMSSSFVKNAGSAVFNTGSFTSPVKAAIYYSSSGNGTLTNTEISSSGGYGVVLDSPTGNNYLTMTGNSFKNNTLAHISATVATINFLFAGAATTTNTFTGAATAVEIPSFSISSQPFGTWASLGGTNAYQFLSSVTHSTGVWTLSPGVNLKFKSNKQLDHTGGVLTAIGTAISPITFDSDAGTAASWLGIGLEASYDLEFCTIKNGGQSEVFKGGSSPATLKANVVFNSTLGTIIFKNNTISGGGGYGTLIESGKLDPQPLLAANSNTYTSNTLGTSLKQP